MPVLSGLVALVVAALPAAALAHPGIHELVAPAHSPAAVPALLLGLSIATLALAGRRLAATPAASSALAGIVSVVAGAALLLA